MREQKLDTMEEERDIRVMVTKTLRPSAQCAKAARMVATVLNQVNSAFHFRKRHIFVRLYTQYVRPHLEFVLPAWSPWTKTDKKCLERVQQKAIRMVGGLESGSYEERLRELGLSTLEQQRHRLDMVQTFKIVRGKENMERETWF
jgi:ribonuclease P/MRP protein subunit RPP40